MWGLLALESNSKMFEILNSLSELFTLTLMFQTIYNFSNLFLWVAVGLSERATKVNLKTDKLSPWCKAKGFGIILEHTLLVTE